MISILYCSGYDYVKKAIQEGQRLLEERGAPSSLFEYWGEEGVEPEDKNTTVPTRFDVIILDPDTNRDLFKSLINNLSDLRNEKTFLLTIHGTKYLRDIGFKDLDRNYNQLAHEISSLAP